VSPSRHNCSFRTCHISCAYYLAEHDPVVAELLVLDVGVVQLVHCAQAVAGQQVDIDDVVVAAEHPVVDVVVAAEHPVVDVVVAAEHPVVDVVVDDVVGAFAEQPCGTEVVVVVVIGVAVAVTAAVIVVELDDVCATTPATPTIESATAAATRKTAIFFMLYLFFLGGLFP
jgi:hypothetical protein